MIKFPEERVGPRSTHPWQVEPTGMRGPESVHPVSFADTGSAWSPSTVARPSLSRGWVDNGPQVTAFEDEFAEFIGARGAVAVSSGMAAVELSLLSLHLPRHSRVLVATTATRGVVNAILRVGLVPALVDVSPDTGKPTPAQVAAASCRDEACGSRPSAIVLDHWSGEPTGVEELAAVAGLPTGAAVQDAAEALGASIDGHRVGSGGTACFSFYSTTNLPVGEGGMVTTEIDDREGWLREARRRRMAPASRRRSDLVPRQRFGSREGGLAATMTDLTAARGRGLLGHVDRWQDRRRSLALRYSTRLAGIPGLRLPLGSLAGNEHSWHAYPVRVRTASERQFVVRALEEAGIATAGPGVPAHQLGYFRALCETPRAGLPGADRHVAETVLLPIYPRLADDVADRVAEVLSTVLGGPGGRASPLPGE